MSTLKADFENYVQELGAIPFLNDTLKLAYFILPISKKHIALATFESALIAQCTGLLQEVENAHKCSLQPILIWEDDWHFKKEMVKSRLESIEGNNAKLHARKCTVKRISKDISAIFLNENHLMGSVSSGFQYGLFFEEKLVAVATFSKARTMNYEEPHYKSSELFRFASLKGITIQGGLSKLLKALVVEQKIEHIMTYTEAMWGEGNAFLALGFQSSTSLPPIAYEVIDSVRYKVAQSKENTTSLVYNAGSNKYVKFYTHAK